MREKDANTGWTAASDGTLEERVFYVQNWRADVVALLDAAGNPLEEIRYSAYGSPSVHPIADVDGNGLVNAADVTAWTNLFAGSSTDTVYEHNNLNRDELFPGDTDDDTYCYARYATGTHGFNKLSSLGNRKGYAGYEWDQTATTWHVRHRVLDSASGKWTRMDPLGYVDGVSVFEYAKNAAVILNDPTGLIAVIAQPCEFDRGDGFSQRCSDHCRANPGGLGYTPDDGSWCCICTRSIDFMIFRDFVRLWQWPWMPHYSPRLFDFVLPIIYKCVALHENIHIDHVDRGWPIERSCKECEAYRWSMLCFVDAMNKCGGDAMCELIMKKMLEDTTYIWARECDNCRYDEQARSERVIQKAV